MRKKLLNNMMVERKFKPLDVKLFTLATGDSNWVHDYKVMGEETIVPAKLVESFALYLSFEHANQFSSQATLPKRIISRQHNSIYVNEPVCFSIDKLKSEEGLESRVTVNGDEKKSEISIAYDSCGINPVMIPKNSKSFSHSFSFSKGKNIGFGHSLSQAYHLEKPNLGYLLSLASYALCESVKQTGADVDDKTRPFVYFKNTAIIETDALNHKFDGKFDMEVFLRELSSGYKGIVYGICENERIYYVESLIKRKSLS